MEFNATERLELQNEVLRTAFGGIVFAPIDLHAGDKVLDVGTGSGLWSLVISFLDLTVWSFLHQPFGSLTATTPTKMLRTMGSI
jgi:tRNA A58 N-methylase Trm61